MPRDYEFTTMVLRFRDLVTEANETINSHLKIIEDHGFVWWAWWNKGAEKVPLEEFHYLRDIAGEGENLTVYLIDSGQGKSYKAICSYIECDTILKPSPDPTSTPEYYNSKNYYAWFKLTSIEPCTEETIKDFTYIRVDSFFIEGTSNYTKFYNKRIYNINELIQQNRTIWFVRPYSIGTDKTHEVVLLNANNLEPANYMKRYINQKGNTILWLSDLHLSDGKYPDKSSPDKKTICENIIEGLKSNNAINLSALMITGDITSRAEKDGYDKAVDFITDINRSLPQPLDSRSILFCPGNHDFGFITPTGKTVEYVTKDTPSTEEFSKFYKKVHFIEPNEYFSCGRKYVLENGLTVEIVALNSQRLQQYKGFEGHGLITQEQLNDVATEMGWDPTAKNNSTRIVLMHHHYLPTCYQDTIDPARASSVVYDAERLSRWLLKYNVKLILHGHKHNKFYSKVYHPCNPDSDINPSCLDFINVIGMGSTGASDIPDGTQNLFALLTFNIDELIVSFFQVTPQCEVKKIQDIKVDL